MWQWWIFTVFNTKKQHDVKCLSNTCQILVKCLLNTCQMLQQRLTDNPRIGSRTHKRHNLHFNCTSITAIQAQVVWSGKFAWHFYTQLAVEFEPCLKNPGIWCPKYSFMHSKKLKESTHLGRKCQPLLVVDRIYGSSSLLSSVPSLDSVQ